MEKQSRRTMLLRIGWTLNGAAALLLLGPLVRYFASPGKKKNVRGDQAWVKLGSVADFPVGETRLATYRNPFREAWDGTTSDIPCWVRRIRGEEFQVFAINCAHLGCPVRWFAQSGLFMCPCHGGAYYEDGSRASGPPPRGLFQYEYQVSDGQLLIHAGQLPTLSTTASIETGKDECRG